MLVNAQIFHDPSFSPFGAGDNGSPQRKKPFRCGLLVWKDGDVEWTIEAWAYRRGEHAVLIRENGKPTDHTLLRWKRGRSEEVDELVISKVTEGRYANETVIDIWASKACINIEKILEHVVVGEVSDRLPIIL